MVVGFLFSKNNKNSDGNSSHRPNPPRFVKMITKPACNWLNPMCYLCSWQLQLAVGSWQLAVGSWQLAVGKLKIPSIHEQTDP
jgi:hypothetical protein